MKLKGRAQAFGDAAGRAFAALNGGCWNAPPTVDDGLEAARDDLVRDFGQLQAQAATLRQRQGGVTALAPQRPALTTRWWGGGPSGPLATAPADSRDALAFVDRLPNSVTLVGDAVLAAQRQAARRLGQEAVTVGTAGHTLLLHLPLQPLGEARRKSFGLAGADALQVELHFTETFAAASAPPDFTLRLLHADTTALEASSSSSARVLPLRAALQLQGIVRRHLETTWAQPEASRVDLAALHTHVKGALARLDCGCVVCGQTFARPQARPTTCAQADCIETFAAQGPDPASLADTAAVDLLVSFGLSATADGRQALCHNPPRLTDSATGRATSQVGPSWVQIGGIHDALRNLPKSGALAAPAALLALSAPARLTLSWLPLTTVEFIPAAQQFAAARTSHQFRVSHGEAGTGGRGRRLKARRWAFHGSAWHNWQSILTIGLQPGATNSGRDFNGSAYGQGIYLATDLMTSLGYAVPNARGRRQDALGGYRCVAVCETRGADVRGGYLVARRAEDVAVRYLLVYDASAYGIRTIPNVRIADLHL